MISIDIKYIYGMSQARYVTFMANGRLLKSFRD